jgi:hypothetical protein
MQSLFTLPILGGSLLAAIAFGVHLGESSIGLINPIYFQAPPLHPRERGAAIDESSLHRAPPVQTALYGWEQGHAARVAECGDCGLRDANVYSARVPYFGNRSDVRAAVAEAPEVMSERFAEAPDDLSHRAAQIERYAHYQVEADEPETGFEGKEILVDDVKPEPQE